MADVTVTESRDNTDVSVMVSDGNDTPHYTTLTNMVLSDTLSSPWQNGQREDAVREGSICDWDYTQTSTPTGNNANAQSTSAMDYYITEIENVKNQPRTIIIDHIRKLTGDNVTDLEMIRNELYQKAVLRDDFPVKDGYLRRRIETRKYGQIVPASLQKKLSKDCFTLLLACDGEFSDDIAEVVPTKKQRSGSVNVTLQKSQTQSDDVAGVQVLTESVAAIQREILEMKSNYKEQIDELKNTINKLLKEKEGAQNRAKKFQAEIKTMKNHLENCGKDHETVRSKLEQLEKDTQQKFENIRQENDKLETNVNSNKEDINEQDNVVQKLSVNMEKKLNLLKSDVSNTKEKMSDCLNIAQRYDDEQQNGVASLKYQIRLTNQKMKQHETDYKDLDEAVEQLKLSTSSLQKQHNDFKKMVSKDHKNAQRTSTTQHGKSIDTTPTQPTINLSNRFQVLDNTNSNEQYKSDTVNKSASDSTTNKWSTEEPKLIPVHCTSYAPATSLGKSSTENPSKRTDEKQRPIQVHCPSSVCNITRTQFSGFKPVNRRKVQRFYVHGINKATSSEELMRQYLERKNINVTFLRYFERDHKRTASAQLNVVDDGNCLVGNRSFWPEGIYVRPWLPREVFLNDNGRA